MDLLSTSRIDDLLARPKSYGTAEPVAREALAFHAASDERDPAAAGDSMRADARAGPAEGGGDEDADIHGDRDGKHFPVAAVRGSIRRRRSRADRWTALMAWTPVFYLRAGLGLLIGQSKDVTSGSWRCFEKKMGRDLPRVEGNCRSMLSVGDGCLTATVTCRHDSPFPLFWRCRSRPHRDRHFFVESGQAAVYCAQAVVVTSEFVYAGEPGPSRFGRGTMRVSRTDREGAA